MGEATIGAAGDEDDEEEIEEARPIVKTRDPGCPTEAERAAHEANHLPFRSWCGECVKGRLDNPPHRKIPQEERGVPEVMMDYGFMSQTGETKSLTVLITKDRDTRVIMANMVMHKGGPRQHKEAWESQEDVVKDRQ